MVLHSALRLEWLCKNITPLLYQINKEEFEKVLVKGKWSKKQILGHLIDSAVNNHQRFIRGQFEINPVILYNQDKWNEFGHYKEIDSATIIETWVSINFFLSVLMKYIPKSRYQNTLDMGNGRLISLEYIIEDYVTHLEHHLHQIVLY